MATTIQDLAAAHTTLARAINQARKLREAPALVAALANLRAADAAVDTARAAYNACIDSLDPTEASKL